MKALTGVWCLAAVGFIFLPGSASAQLLPVEPLSGVCGMTEGPPFDLLCDEVRRVAQSCLNGAPECPVPVPPPSNPNAVQEAIKRAVAIAMACMAGESECPASPPCDVRSGSCAIVPQVESIAQACLDGAPECPAPLPPLSDPRPVFNAVDDAVALAMACLRDAAAGGSGCSGAVDPPYVDPEQDPVIPPMSDVAELLYTAESALGVGDVSHPPGDLFNTSYSPECFQKIWIVEGQKVGTKSGVSYAAWKEATLGVSTDVRYGSSEKPCGPPLRVAKVTARGSTAAKKDFAPFATVNTESQDSCHVDYEKSDKLYYYGGGPANACGAITEHRLDDPSYYVDSVFFKTGCARTDPRVYTRPYPAKATKRAAYCATPPPPRPPDPCNEFEARNCDCGGRPCP